MAVDFKLPELGENIETIQVVKVLVAVGDAVAENQPVLELETDKATVEVPSSVAGTVSAVHVREGDEIKVGQAVLSVDGGTQTVDASPAKETPPPVPPPPASEDPVPAPEAAKVSPPGNKPRAASAAAATATSGRTVFTVPELGENIETIQVVRVMVKSGDRVALDQPVLELETDKATVEVPSSVAGTVSEVFVKEGDELSVGATVFTCEGGGTSAPATVTDSPDEPTATATPSSAEAAEAPPPDEPGAAPEQFEEVPRARPARMPAAGRRVPAAPSVRRFAREIGITIEVVPGSGSHGRVSTDDVKQYAKALNEDRATVRSSLMPAPAATAALPPLPDFARWGDVSREKMSVIRRKTAEHMTLSWQQIPHVTLFDAVDVTELDALRKRYAERVEATGSKLTMMAMVIKVVAQALRVFPRFNASVDMESRELIYKDYINVGVAVDTARGLVVPVIQNADRQNMIEIAAALTQIADKARTGKIALEDIEGGTFTISNLGRTCGTHFTPIVNYPEVAILGVGRMTVEPDSPRKMLPLSLSFDHRVIDGSDGVRFLGWIIEALGEPLVLSLEG
jgi:pyruvate dehydrogenase E2 component (dihydrolipoamide acetyltransferase)